MPRKAVEILGWIGVSLILIAYASVSLEWVTSGSFGYQFMNLIGAILILVASWFKKDYQPFALNVVWAAIALISIIGLL